MKVKALAILAALVFGGQAWAEGKITFKFPVMVYNGDPWPEIGLFISEPVYKNFRYQSWTGGRWPRWLTTSQEMRYDIPETGTSVGTGIQVYHDPYFGTEVRYNLIWEQRLW
jgi:hypothetical protein